MNTLFWWIGFLVCTVPGSALVLGWIIWTVRRLYYANRARAYRGVRAVIGSSGFNAAAIRASVKPAQKAFEKAKLRGNPDNVALSYAIDAYFKKLLSRWAWWRLNGWMYNGALEQHSWKEHHLDDTERDERIAELESKLAAAHRLLTDIPHGEERQYHLMVVWAAQNLMEAVHKLRMQPIYTLDQLDDSLLTTLEIRLMHLNEVAKAA